MYAEFQLSSFKTESGIWDDVQNSDDIVSLLLPYSCMRAVEKSTLVKFSKLCLLLEGKKWLLEWVQLTSCYTFFALKLN